MMQNILKHRVCVCLLGSLFLGFCGCSRSAPQFYARDMSSGWLMGPFELKAGTAVRARRSGFLIARPNDGEVEVMAKLKTVKIDIEAHDLPLPEFVEKLMASQRRAVGPEHIIPIEILHTDVWHQYSDWPRITFTARGVSLYQTLDTVQTIETRHPFIYEVKNNGVVIWPQDLGR